MPYYKFGQNDLFVNRVKTYPRVQFFIYGGVIYYQNQGAIEGEFSASAKHIPSGHLSLHEINADMPERSDTKSLIYPFVTKEGSLSAFKTISTSEFNNDFAYGDVLTGSYPLSASVVREYFAANHGTNFNTNTDAGDSSHVLALKNTLNYYSSISTHYKYSNETSVGTWDKDVQAVNLISIPSIFYGSSIKKGSVELNFYITGSLVGQLKDEKRNGELIQTLPSGHDESGSVAGVVLYNEGFLLLTGSWDISQNASKTNSSEEHSEEYLDDTNELHPSWLHFAAGANDGLMTHSNHTASSFRMTFHGTSYTQVMTMFAHAEKSILNHSNNPTFVKFADSSKVSNVYTSSADFRQDDDIRIRNTVSGNYTDQTASFGKQTYISKIGIYDDDKNLIAIAKMATPVKKTEERNLTFKLKLDI